MKVASSASFTFNFSSRSNLSFHRRFNSTGNYLITLKRSLLFAYFDVFFVVLHRVIEKLVPFCAAHYFESYSPEIMGKKSFFFP